jgi:hypothetical protein
MGVVRKKNQAIVTFEDDAWKTAAPDVFSVADGTTPFYSADTWLNDGKNTLRSGAIGNSGTSETTITFTFTEAGSISLNYIVSSESNYDKLHIFVDGTEVVTASGTTATSFASYSKTVEAGSHVLKLQYTKDSSQSKGKDAGAIGFITVIGVVRDYQTRYLLSDFNGKIYTVIDGTVTELTDATAANLQEKAYYEAHGFVDDPTSAQITSLTKPVIYRWTDKSVDAMKAEVTAVPQAQTIRTVADMSDATIKGISQITAVYTGNINVSYSYDDVTYTEPVAMADFLTLDVSTLYASANGKVYFKFVIVDENSALTNFVITYVN